MNWYKNAQENNEWNFPEAEHDYNPSWDYEIDEIPDSQLVNITENILSEDINGFLLPKIGMGKAKTAYIKNEGNSTLAKYVYGTAPYPVFVINLQEIKKSSDKYGVEIETAIETTLTHELGHAIQDWMGLDLDERVAEEFARHWYDFRQIWNFWE